MKRHAGSLAGTAEVPPIPDGIAAAPRTVSSVESRMGAVAWGLWPTPRFPSPLIKPSVPISGTRLSDWLHRKAHDGRPLDAVSSDDTPARDVSSPCDMSFH